LGGFFFLLHLIDWSTPWHPESKIIIDIPTALSFFLDHREHTKKKVTKMAQRLVDAWNEAYGGTKNVIFFLYLCVRLKKLQIFLNVKKNLFLYNSQSFLFSDCQFEIGIFRL
jgi:hypothetical protein